MGTTYRFHCSRCGHDAEISGAQDAGFHVATQTFACLDCQGLCDATTGLTPHAPADVEHDPAAPPRCPHCGGADLTPWNGGDPCPRCGGVMADEGLVALWD